MKLPRLPLGRNVDTTVHVGARAAAVISVAGVLVLGAGSFAAASSAFSGASSSGVIATCMSSSGSLRVVDHRACKPGEQLLTWNQKGPKGDPGTPGAAGPAGATGADGNDGAPGKDGAAGKDGYNGGNGRQGLSAYDVAVAHGFTGTVTDWLASLKGSPASLAGVDCGGGKYLQGFDSEGGKICVTLPTATSLNPVTTCPTGTSGVWPMCAPTINTVPGMTCPTGATGVWPACISMLTIPSIPSIGTSSNSG